MTDVYKYIRIEPIPQPMGVVLGDEQYNKDVRFEVDVALAAPAMLKLLKGVREVVDFKAIAINQNAAAVLGDSIDALFKDLGIR